MKIFKKALHYWIAIASVFSFLGGWALLAHSPKPVQPASVANIAPLQNLPPIQAFGEGSQSGQSQGGLNLFTSNNQPSAGVPLLRTGGS